MLDTWLDNWVRRIEDGSVSATDAYKALRELDMVLNEEIRSPRQSQDNYRGLKFQGTKQGS
jgi:hypothetical protein